MRKKTIIYIYLLFVAISTAYSHTVTKSKAPDQGESTSSKRKVKMSGIHRGLPLMAKTTNGILSTVAGASMFIAMPVADATSGQKVNLKLKYFKKGEQGQFVFGRSIPLIFVNPRRAISWGLFQVNPSADEAGRSWRAQHTMSHELGHGVAVDMMGPLILPIGLVDYINSGTLNPQSPHYKNSFIEQAADMEAAQDEMIYRQFHLGLSSEFNLTPGMYFFIKDETSYEDTKNPRTLFQQKQFHFLKTGLQINANQDCDCVPSAWLSGEFGLGDYETSMLVGEGLKLSLKGFYKVLDYKRDRHSDSRLDLYQGDNLAGVAIPLGGSSHIDLKGGISLRSSAYFNDEQFHLIDIYAGLAAEANISIEDLLKIQAYYQTHAGLQSSTTRYGGSVTSNIPVGETMGVDISVNGEREEINPDKGQEIQIDHLRINAGINF